MSLRIIAPPRGQDDYGEGHFGASRDGGTRQHNGQDYAVWPGSLIHPFVGGHVDKLGYVYSDDLTWRYVRIEDAAGWSWRYLYVSPTVSAGDYVTVDTIIGVAQDLRLRYPRDDARNRSAIHPHVHVDVQDENGTYLDPEKL